MTKSKMALNQTSKFSKVLAILISTAISLGVFILILLGLIVTKSLLIKLLGG